MNERVIGRVTTVLFNKIIFEIFDTDALSFNYKGNFYKSNGLNDFITISKDAYTKYVYQVGKTYVQNFNLAFLSTR